MSYINDFIQYSIIEYKILYNMNIKKYDSKYPIYMPYQSNIKYKDSYLYLNKYVDNEDISKILIIKDTPVHRRKNLNDKYFLIPGKTISILKYRDGSINMSIIDEKDDNYEPVNLEIKNNSGDDKINIYNTLEYLFYTPESSQNHKRLKKIIYDFIYGRKQIKKVILRRLISDDFEQAIIFLDNNMKLLPNFIDIVYFENNDPRYFEVLHERINKVIVDDEKLKLYSNRSIMKMYYVLAQIIMSDLDVYNTDEGKISVLEYLFKSGNFMDAKELKNKIIYSMMGYNLGESPGFVINLDVETIYNLVKMINKK